MSIKLFRHFIIGFATLFLLAHCSEQGVSPNLKEASELTAEGWQAFENGEYGMAAAKFDSAIQSDANFVDAYNGAGWAYSRLEEFNLALNKFETALSKTADLIEAQAGTVLLFHVLNRFEEAIEAALALLEVAPNFMFSHDPAIDSLDIRITLAISFYSVGDFARSAGQMDIIDPDNKPHSTEPDGLIKEIMRFFGLIR